MQASLYVHVPFCVVKCGYCDFNSYVVEDEQAHDRYLEALAAELARRWPRGGRPVSVFVGGGTPSLLSVGRLERLFAIIGEHVDLLACAEVSMEANPESFTVDKARAAWAGGVRRLSMGAQSFHAHHLQQLDRAHDAAAVERAFAAAREAGFENVSVDLMFGIPGETLDEWRSDLERVLELGTDHLSCYNLTFEPGTRFERDRQRGRIAPNEQELDRAMFEHTRARLGEAGFVAYEVSNFAGRGGPCRHNDHYWLQGDYVGVGPGASSHRGGVRTSNLKPLDTWCDAALAGQPCAASAETLRPLQRAAEALWLGVRRTDGVDVDAVASRIDVDVRGQFEPVIERQVRAGLVAFDGGRLRLVGEGLLLADQVGGDYLEVAL
ncbi:MAG: radical SAM family heme chaperone HemW [Planctomycetes bacterium]|nr:radical SAM family heme chaperone HemW [Planctomycetota bacterium]